MKKLILFFFVFPFFSLQAEEGVLFRYQLDKKVKIIEKYNYRLYQNGRYIGHVNHENRAILNHENSDPGFLLKGDVYQLREIKRGGEQSAPGIDQINQISYRMDSQGRIYEADGPFPFLRDFPFFPQKPVKPGDSWEAPARLIIYSPDRNSHAELPILCGYQYSGLDYYKGRQVHVISARFTPFYRQGRSRKVDTVLHEGNGSHVCSFLLDKETKSPLLLKDQFEEQFRFADGSQETRKGFNLVFYDGIRSMDKDFIRRGIIAGIIGDDDKGPLEKESPSSQNPQDNNKTPDTGKSAQNIEDDLSEEDKKQIEVEKREEGIALILKDLHFKPDTAILLERDRPLLDKIASQLKRVPERSFLIKGHSADVGRPTAQKKLSIERAKTITSEIQKRGIPPTRMMYVGMGAKEPLAPNTTEEGRKKNRRVEIIILED